MVGREGKVRGEEAWMGDAGAGRSVSGVGRGERLGPLWAVDRHWRGTRVTLLSAAGCFFCRDRERAVARRWW